ncbi:hypothetical protein D2E76_15835 [Mycobacteroides abscessus]|uniref:Uncharacterized protein n=1 Tax=Mycobacteroides abscessus TaxID=36809 RepID=A0ABD7HML0_9MYCO|nr:hypothetical protein [Mycobacteroides abscessus]RIT36731.1 hypothetical protein D2E76_15835 [Mycobacteroides abscessus]
MRDYGDDGGALQWWAATTEPDGTDLAWCVRYHPLYGRSVVLVKDEVAFTLHEDWEGSGRRSGPLLFRMGGYWWDGISWYRPLQIFDYAAERYARRKAPSARTITAADILADDHASAGSATVLTIADVHRHAEAHGEVRPMAVDNWNAHLKLWAGRRRNNAYPLSKCVVDISAPELAAGLLIGTPEMASMAGIAASTLRAYSARGENDLPAHQGVIAGRKMWSRPVAADWAESRSRLPENAAAALAASSELSVGQADLFARFSASFFTRLWSKPFRKLWRLKDESSARARSNELAMLVATNLEDIVPIDALKFTVRQAVLHEFQHDIEAAAAIGRPERMDVSLWPLTAKMLDWIVRHHPRRAGNLINDIIGSAERDLNVPREQSIAAIRRSLAQDGKLAVGAYDAFLERILPPLESCETFRVEGATVYLDGNPRPVASCESAQEAERVAEKLNNDPGAAQLAVERLSAAPAAGLAEEMNRIRRETRETIELLGLDIARPANSGEATDDE